MMALPDFYSQWTNARQNGEQRASDQTVRQNIGGALQGDSGALSAILKASPQMGMQLQDRQSGQKQAQLQQLGKFASAYVQTRDPMIWKQMHPLLVQAGAPADMPADLATPEDMEGSIRAAQSFAAMYGSGQQTPEQFTLSPGSKRFGPDGRVIAEVPFAPKSPQLFTDANGGVHWLTPPDQGGIPQQTAGMGGAAGQIMDRAYTSTVDPVKDFQAFASMPGVQVSSLYRDPKHNAKVGGVQNSYHTKGQAGDFVVPPAQRAAFIQQAQAQGYDAIDEGDHVHVEPRRGARATSQYGAGQGISTIPGLQGKGAGTAGDKAANWQVIQGNDGQFYRLNKLTGQVEAAGVTGNNAARIQKMEQERLEKVQGIQGAIAQTDGALQSLETLMTSPGLGRAVGVGSMLPTLPGTDSATFEAQLDTFKAQTFVPMVAQLKGMGALSDAEGKKLSEAVGALSLKMGDVAFKKSLAEIKLTLNQAKTRAANKVTEINRAASSQSRSSGPAPKAEQDSARQALLDKY